MSVLIALDSMNTDKIIPVRKEHLLLMQVLCWMGPGIKILTVGINSLLVVAENDSNMVWWLIGITVIVAIGFSIMFDRFIRRYTIRILNFEQPRKSIFAFFDLRGYILIFFMMCLGIGLKFIPGMPTAFFAGFYPGLGMALTIAGIRLITSWIKAIKQEQ